MTVRPTRPVLDAVLDTVSSLTDLARSLRARARRARDAEKASSAARTARTKRAVLGREVRSVARGVGTDLRRGAKTTARRVEGRVSGAWEALRQPDGEAAIRSIPNARGPLRDWPPRSRGRASGGAS